MRRHLAGRQGLTLIELMIVILIIGILASMALATWQSRKTEAIVAAMKSDLRNLAAAQEAYRTDHLAYTADAGELDFRSSPDIVLTLQADEDGWTAKASHPTSSKECALSVGDIAPLSPARGEGIVWCE